MKPLTKTVNLKQPTIVNDVLRYPVEGTLTVSDDEAQRLDENNLLVDKPGDFVAVAEVPSVAEDSEYVRDSLHALELAKADKKQLLVIAAYEQADVLKGDRATIPELITAIEAKRNAG